MLKFNKRSTSDLYLCLSKIAIQYYKAQKLLLSETYGPGIPQELNLNCDFLSYSSNSCFE